MKKHQVFIGFVSLICGFLGSCALLFPVSPADSLYRTMSDAERKEFQVIGRVQTRFSANVSRWNKSFTPSNREEAYNRLLIEAKKQYQRNDIDVRNIVLDNTTIGRWENVNIVVNGDVVTSGSASNIPEKPATEGTGIEAALARAAGEILKNVPRDTTIAIVYITAPDQGTTDFITGELEYMWVKAGYAITDRSQLDKLRQEQNLHMNGTVDDSTAVSIGKIAGANIIVTGSVDGEGNLRRLRLRALDTETARVAGVASERL